MKLKKRFLVRYSKSSRLNLKAEFYEVGLFSLRIQAEKLISALALNPDFLSAEIIEKYVEQL